MVAADANDVAYYLVEKFSKEGRPLTNIKLQKVLYFSWIHFYNSCKQPLFRQQFSAWRFGPVIDDVYFRYRVYAAMPIYEPLGKQKELPAYITKFLDTMFSKYKDTSPSQLVNMAHKEGGAWDKVYREGDRGIPLPFSVIIRYDCPRFADG